MRRVKVGLVGSGFISTIHAEALKRVARLIADDEVTEELALGMTRAFARTADRLAVWQTQLVAESLTSPFSEELEGRDSRSVPELQVATAAAELLASICDDIEPLLVPLDSEQAEDRFLNVFRDLEAQMAQG